MKLWHCTAEIEFVVAAEECPKPGFDLDYLAAEEARDNGFDSCICLGEIVSAEDLPERWDEACCPRSDETDKTIGQILLDNLANEQQIPKYLPGQKEMTLE